MQPDGQIGEFNENMLNFDANPVNTFIFYQTVLAVKNPVQAIGNRFGNVVVLAVGDANASPHSLTASGLSTGIFD